MKYFNVLYDTVAQVLEESPKTRDDKDLLYYEVVKRYTGLSNNALRNNISFYDMYCGEFKGKFPKYTTVVRYYNLHLELHPELRGSKYNEGKKEEQEGKALFSKGEQ